MQYSSLLVLGSEVLCLYEAGHGTDHKAAYAAIRLARRPLPAVSVQPADDSSGQMLKSEAALFMKLDDGDAAGSAGASSKPPSITIFTSFVDSHKHLTVSSTPSGARTHLS